MRDDLPRYWSLGLAICLFLCVFGITHTSSVLAQSELPADVRADILQRKILDSARANDLLGALAEIDEYKSLKVPIPPAVLLVEAKAAHRTGDALRAFASLKAYLAVGQRGSKGYDEALALYSDFEKEAAPAIQKAEESKHQAEREQLEAIAKEKAQKLHEADLAKQRSLELEKKRLLDDMMNGLEVIPGGRFQMGSDIPYLGESQPVHTVDIKEFKTGRTLVTCYQFRIYIAASGNGSWHEDCNANFPLISWNDANGFIEWLSDQTGTKFRMLSEAEWEWIARNRRGPLRTSVNNTELAPRPGLGLEIEFLSDLYERDPMYDPALDHKARHFQQGEWVADCENVSYQSAPMDGTAQVDKGNCDRHVLRGVDFVGKTLHRALIFGSNNYYTYDDSAFIAGRAFGRKNQLCGSLATCSIRVATSP